VEPKKEFTIGDAPKASDFAITDIVYDDNSHGSGTVTGVTSPASLDSFGTNIPVTVTYEDDQGNTGTATAYVTVNPDFTLAGDPAQGRPVPNFDPDSGNNISLRNTFNQPPIISATAKIDLSKMLSNTSDNNVSGITVEIRSINAHTAIGSNTGVLVPLASTDYTGSVSLSGKQLVFSLAPTISAAKNLSLNHGINLGYPNTDPNKGAVTNGMVWDVQFVLKEGGVSSAPITVQLIILGVLAYS